MDAPRRVLDTQESSKIHSWRVQILPWRLQNPLLEGHSGHGHSKGGSKPVLEGPRTLQGETWTPKRAPKSTPGGSKSSPGGSQILLEGHSGHGHSKGCPKPVQGAFFLILRCPKGSPKGILESEIDVFSPKIAPKGAPGRKKSNKVIFLQNALTMVV